ncbi:hypothetical protein LG409_14250 [Halomonas sp. NyZ770]|uniref:phosphoribosyltransferase-like protein n=1 Tax=Halomonas sp. NyZ770 TaxID=2883106 RepID=UPI001D0B89D5|nr:hypothetical protein [Halomonas sp. NyZ770]UDM06529.1 hypothetical protein LG409_14250 [Halomonas sp. NyZ770]
MNELTTVEKLETKIMKLSQTVWENKVNESNLQNWLDNFTAHTNIRKCEKTQALFLLSNFMYFGVREIRELLRSVYRDKFYNPLVQTIRKDNNNTIDFQSIKQVIDIELSKTRFLGVGNPSESGTHLLYFFRQENELDKNKFMHVHEIFSFNRSRHGALDMSLADQNIKRYIFIDDVCGSGDQAVNYSKKIVDEIKNIDSNIEVYYYTLFATSKGIEKVKNETSFDRADSVFILDETFKCFSDKSRYFSNAGDDFCKNEIKKTCEKYARLISMHPAELLGYGNGQLLLGFYHNTPDNTLPVFWQTKNWNPIFKRYTKLYGNMF